MRPYSNKKFVFAEKQQEFKEQTPQKKYPVRGQSSASRTSNVPATQPIRGKVPDGRQTTLQPPPQIPKYKRPVDILEQANKIVERARRAEREDDEVKQDVRSAMPTKKIDHAAGKPSKVPTNIQSPKEIINDANKKEHPLIKNEVTKNVKEPTTNQSTKNIKEQPPNPPSNNGPSTNNASTKQTNQPQPNPPPSIPPFRQQQLLSKIDYLQQQLNSSTRQFQQLQTKYNSLTKQHKNCTKQIKKLTQAIKQKQANLTKLIQKDEIPYNKKRQCILQAQLQNLRSYNRELTLRLKAYRASQLTQMALQYNKVNILNEYEKEQMVDPADSMLKLESLAYQMVGNMDKYMANRKKWTFQDQQKYMLELNKIVYDFSMCCLVQGIKLPTHEKKEYGEPVQQKVQQEIKKTGLLTGQQLVIRNTQHNIKICQEIDMMMEDQRELLTYMEPRHLREMLEECLKGMKKVNPQQIRTIEDRILSRVERYRRQNDILVATIVSVLARCQMLQHNLNEKIALIETNLKKISKPLDDLQSLFDYGGQKDDQTYRDKLSFFIRNNIQDLRMDISKMLKQKMPQMLIDFARLRTLL